MTDQNGGDAVFTRGGLPMAGRMASMMPPLLLLAGFALPATAATLVLPQIAVGGGYTTTIMVMTGGTATGMNHLTLRDQNGNPLTVRSGGSLPWSETSFSLPPYGSQVWKLEPTSPDGELQVGSAVVLNDAPQGTIYGVATFEYRVGGVLRTAVGVIGSEPVDGVTIPVDSDDGESRYPGFAVANLTVDDLDLTVTLFDLGGKQAYRFQLRVPKQGQIARFLRELVPGTARFKGLMVIKAAAGGRFAAVALSMRSEVFASLPVIPAALYPF